ncbi:phage major tail protein, phi13 family [Mesobacillus persicus]|uniref:Phage major tail protein, phi13 family n=1 Tax=Mesobacillus persicus TaxID=930146 RepID=A0A1H7XM93_9BACI|nr:major tail protein [Mesobacillus persicus]SEM34795.1 phage major tail protein, phi13 family [Mesobacillus persicus]
MAGVVIGAKKPHFAILTSDGATPVYEVPVKMGKAINITITPNINTNTLYADDQASETNTALGAIEVAIELDQLSSDVRQQLLGITKNADGVLEYKAEQNAPYVAFGFESPLSTGGDRLTWMLKGQFSIPADSYQTKGESVEYQTKTINGTFVVREDENWKYEVDSNDPEVNADVIANWFNAVYAPTPAV